MMGAPEDYTKEELSALASSYTDIEILEQDEHGAVCWTGEDPNCRMYVKADGFVFHQLGKYMVRSDHVWNWTARGRNSPKEKLYAGAVGLNERITFGEGQIGHPNDPICFANSNKIEVKVASDTQNPKDLLGMKKPPLHLVPSTAIVHTAMAMADGAAKYGPYNWRENDVLASIYVAAAERHIRAWYDGEDNAEDSGAHHLGHAMACLAILLDAEEGENLVDDRPEPGGTSALIKRLTES